MEIETKELAVFEKTKAIMRSEEVIARYTEALGNDRQAKKFIGSVLLVCSQSDKLMECTPKSIIVSGMRAANLRLSVDPALGHGYIVPYKNKGVPTATFITGYKGYKQLAYRTGQYKFINEKIVYEGQSIEEDDFSGIQKVVGLPKYYKDGYKPIGYWMGFELKTGFRQTFYMTKEEVQAHAERYASTYNRFKKEWYPDSKWVTDFDAMAIKTVIRLGLSRYGFFDDSDLLELAATDEVIEDDELFTDDYIEGELLESALEQEAERKEELVGGKSTEELSAMLGFEDDPDTRAKKKLTPEEKKQQEALDWASAFKSKQVNKTYGKMNYEELQAELMTLTGYNPKTDDERTQVNDRIQAVKILIKYLE